MRRVPFEPGAPAPSSTCRARSVSGPGLEAFSGPIPCSSGFCMESAPGPAHLWALAGTSAASLWAAGDGALLHFDGSRWDTACGPLDGWMLQTAYAAGDADVWVAGRASIAHYDGSWRATPADPQWNAFEIWGDRGEAFVTYSSLQPGIGRWDGATWRTSYGEPYASNLSVWGNGAGGVWGIDGGLLIAWDGTSWTKPARPHNLIDLWAPPGGQPWFAGFTFRDPEWWVHDAAVSTIEAGAYVMRPLPPGYSEAHWVRGSAAENVWVGAVNASLGGAVDTWRWDGAAWQLVPRPSATHWSPPLVLGPAEAWLAEGEWDSVARREVTRVKRYDGARWSESLALDAPWVAAVVTAPSGVWVAAEDGIWRHDGSRWTRVHGRLGYTVGLAADGAHVWAAARADDGSASIFHWIDGRASTHRVPRAPTALHARGGHAWVAIEGSVRDGVDAVVHHWDGASWRALDTGAEMQVANLWASGPNDVWAVGAVVPTTWTSQIGVIAHWDGSAWARREFRDYGFRTVWGTAATDVWISGDTQFCQKCPPVAPAPLLLRWDGARLTEAAQVVLDDITGATGAGGEGALWAVGSAWSSAMNDRALTVYRFDGARWSAAAQLEVPFRPYRLHVANDGTLWGADAGRIVRRRAP